MENSCQPFSVQQRAAQLEQQKNTVFDVLIIGGGITGAGIALDAATRGLSVLLLEKNDFAFGTSSRSTKLIHGGLRYLKNLDISLVREVAQERAVLHKNASHLVLPEKMLLPITQTSSLSRLTAFLGVSFYDFLGKVKPEERCNYLSAKKVKQLEPLLEQQHVLGGVLYTEYRTDDARLTLEVLKTAVAHGAVCLNYAEVQEITEQNGKATGIKFYDKLQSYKLEVQAKVLVNATGPWLEQFLPEQPKPRLCHSKGIHIVVSRKKLPLQQSIYFEAKDQRLLFIIPRNEIVYIGTTDTVYNDDLEQPQATENEVKYLLEQAKQLFPSAKITFSDVLSSWAGIRPLISEKASSTSQISRKDEIWELQNGLISVAGGKLTAYRAMAEKVVDKIMQHLKEKEQRTFVFSGTRTISLCCSFSIEDKNEEKLLKNLRDSFPEIEKTELQKLLNRYGKNTSIIVKNAAALASAEVGWVEALLRAEVQFSVEFESVAAISDFLIRRRGSLYFEPQLLPLLLPLVKDEIRKLLMLSKEEIENQLQEFKVAQEQSLNHFRSSKKENTAG